MEDKQKKQFKGMYILTHAGQNHIISSVGRDLRSYFKGNFQTGTPGNTRHIPGT